MDTKKKQVESEAARLHELFSGNSESERTYIEKQVNQLAWYNVSIADLQRDIDRAGTMVEYVIGASLTGMRRNPDIDTLVQYQKLATGIAKNLAKFLNSNEPVSSKLEEFFNSR